MLSEPEAAADAGVNAWAWEEFTEYVPEGEIRIFQEVVRVDLSRGRS